MTQRISRAPRCSWTAAQPSCGEISLDIGPQIPMHSHPADRPLVYLLFVCIVATLAGFLFGFDASVINGTVAALSKEFGSSSVGTGFSVSSVLIGSALGALLAGRYAESLGRKPLMLITAVL